MNSTKPDLDGKHVLVTGGTGSFGRRFVRTVLLRFDPARLIVFSRDEQKHYQMMQELGDPRIRHFVGDVRDLERLNRAFRGVDVVVHAAATKHIPIAEYNPFEAIKTNILGTANVIEAAINQGVKRIVSLSSDKACNPINLYGATKLCGDKLIVAGNHYCHPDHASFAVVRYGNVIGSKGSVVPAFKEQAKKGVIQITDARMTRFWMEVDRGVDLVLTAIALTSGCEIFIPKIPSMKLLDLARAIAPDARQEIVGIRPGEKLHEMMIPADEARHSRDFGEFFVIFPATPRSRRPPPEWVNLGKPVADRFVYSSETNDEWLTVEELRRRVEIL
ncbi:MAG: UDP-N-acetylglucosamine 4,6-dehydratase (inverting) [Planctomycetes bacterium]|nr:UDP-N-acetylglucosamine 4,6-dehydratase (inverting) [Planctomycetota bacterium]